MEPTTDKYRQSLGKKEAFLIVSLSRADKTIFTAEDAHAVIGEDAKKLLFSLARKKWVLKLKRGLYAIVPLDISVKGADSLAIHPFVIASRLADPYYIGFWSALNHYGFSNQIPSAIFVATTKAMKNIKIPDSSFVFVQINSKKFLGILETEILGHKVRTSDKSKTIADCLDHPDMQEVSMR